MKVFLVRHGATRDQADEKSWQFPNSPLTTEGKKQAKILAGRVKSWGIDAIVTSKWKRAKETAEVVSKTLGLQLKALEEVSERRQSAKIYGAKLSSKTHQKYSKDFLRNFSLDWKFYDEEESLRNVANRAIKFKNRLIQKHLGGNLLVVSHDIFIRCFVAACILGDNYEDSAFIKIFRSLWLENTGISLLWFNEKAERWKVLYLNNYSHLKDVK